MISFLYLLLPLVSYAGSTTECNYKYTVKVKDAKGLETGDMEGWLMGDIDVYVEVYGYGEKGGSKNYETKTINNDEEPEWNQEFTFDDETCDPDVGKYEYLFFKLYDEDLDVVWHSDSDFLGQTEKFYLSEVKDCVELFTSEMRVFSDDMKTECGTLFIEVTKEGECCTNGGGYDDDEEPEKEEKEKGGGKSKRLLMA